MSICLLLTADLLLTAAPLQNTSWQTPAEVGDESKQQELDENLQPVSRKNNQADAGDSRRENTVVTERNNNISYAPEESDRKKRNTAGSSSGRTGNSREGRLPPAPTSLPKIDRTVYRQNLTDRPISNSGRNNSYTRRGDVVIDGNSVAIRWSASKSGSGKKTKITHGKIDYCHDTVLVTDKSCTAKSRSSGSSCKSCKTVK